MAKVWDQKILLSTEASGAGSLEISPNVDELNIQFFQSGTATTVTVQRSIDNTNWHTLFSTASATFHAATVVPRYLKAYTENTADSVVTVLVQYRI